MNEATSEPNLLDMTADIIAAYVSANTITPDALPGLIANVHGAMSGLGNSVEAVEEVTAKATPGAIRKSITPDALVSFEDGQGYKSLRRHLSARGMTPDHYRAKYGLPADYPMVAPSYSAARSALAKANGLGQVRKNANGKGGRKPKT